MQANLISKKKSKDEVSTERKIAIAVMELLSILLMMFLAFCLLWGIMVNAGTEPLPFGISTFFIESRITEVFDYLTNSNISRETDSWGFSDTFAVVIACFFANTLILYEVKDESYMVVVGHAINLCLYLILLIACTLIAFSF